MIHWERSRCTFPDSSPTQVEKINVRWRSVAETENHIFFLKQFHRLRMEMADTLSKRFSNFFQSTSTTKNWFFFFFGCAPTVSSRARARPEPSRELPSPKACARAPKISLGKNVSSQLIKTLLEGGGKRGTLESRTIVDTSWRYEGRKRGRRRKWTDLKKTPRFWGRFFKPFLVFSSF